MRNINTDDITPEKAAEHMEYLKRFMSDERIAILERVLNERTDYITVCLENIYHSHNASAVLRSCEAFGVQTVYAIEDDLPFQPAQGIVRGTDKWLDIHRYGEENATENVINKLKKDGYRIVATSPHADGKSPERFDISAGKTALFLGTEKYGLSDTALDMSDEYITIPMYGFVESLNLSVCAAIILSNLSQRLRNETAIDWSLPAERKREILYRWYLNSVRNSDRILLKYERDNENR